MRTDLKHGLITDQILRVFYDVYNELARISGVRVSQVVGDGSGIDRSKGL